MDNWFNLIPVIVLAASCLFIVVNVNWQRIILGYAAIFISAFCIIIQYWSFSFSLVILLTGLMSLVVLGISINKRYEDSAPKVRSEWVFRLVALCLIFIIMIFMVNRISIYLSIPLELGLASLLIIGFGLFQLGITHEPYKIILAIIALLFGFELVFSANESSLLVNGLLALISLLIALMGGYMIINEFERGEE